MHVVINMCTGSSLGLNDDKAYQIGIFCSLLNGNY